jgi:hypothetical protein
MSFSARKGARRSFRVIPVAILAAVTVAVTGVVARADTPATTTVAAPAAAAVDPVIQWNRVLLGILGTPGAQPATVHATRSLAILHAAIYDAVNSIEHTSKPYLVSIKSPRRADPTAAAAAAGYTVLANLYPSQQETLASQFASSLAQVPNGYHKFEGVRVGEGVANALLALRADDGSTRSPFSRRARSRATTSSRHRRLPSLSSRSGRQCARSRSGRRASSGPSRRRR